MGRNRFYGALLTRTPEERRMQSISGGGSDIAQLAEVYSELSDRYDWVLETRKLTVSSED